MPLTPEEHNYLALLRKMQSEGGQNWNWANMRALSVLEQCLEDKPPGISCRDYETCLHLRKKWFVYHLKLDADENNESRRLEPLVWAYTEAAKRRKRAEVVHQEVSTYVPLSRR
jgi:hypothetical protein